MEISTAQLIPLTTIEKWEIFGWEKNNDVRSEFALHSARNQVVARFWKIGVKAPQIRAQTFDTRYDMKQMGFMGRKIGLFVEGSNTGPIAMFSFSGIFGKGTLKFPDGRKFKWGRSAIAGTQWAFFDSDKEEIIRFEKATTLWTDQTWVRLAHRVDVMPDVTALLVLGWYLILLMTFNEHANIDSNAPPAYREFVR